MFIEFVTRHSKANRDLVSDILFFAQQQLFPRHKHVYINIEGRKDLDVAGDCMHEDDREFTIRYDKTLPEQEIISTLLHEMIHVDQYLRNFEFDYSLPYLERPHEIDAHNREMDLVEAYNGQ